MRKFLSILLFFNFSLVFAQQIVIDPTFNIGSGFNGLILSTSIQSDGKIIVGGGYTSFNGITRNRIARLNADGTLDATFNPGSGFDAGVNSTAVQTDGKIIVGGTFSFFNGVALNKIVRLNADGTLDATFNIGTGFNQEVRTIAIQSDGKILVGGWFSNFNGINRYGLARLNTDGSLDATFNSGTGFNTNQVDAIVIQSDGKILVGGGFTSFNGTSRNRIARLNIDGTLDATFNPGTGFSNTVRTISIQPDDKIIVGGYFGSFNGTQITRIARLNSDGTLDSSFDPGSGFSNGVYTSAIQSDGKIIVGGEFTSFNGFNNNRIARLNSDGTIDTSFNTGLGFNGGWLVYVVAIQLDGKIIVGGDFTSFNTTLGINSIARLFNCDQPSYGIDVVTACGSFVWIDGNTYTSNNNTATHNIIGGSSNGCDSIITLNLTINPLPIPNIISNTPLCSGQSLSLTTSSSGMNSYSWTGPNGFSSSLQNINITNVSINETGIYHLTIIDANGCSNYITSSVTVNPLPNPVINSNTPLCIGQTLNLSATLSGMNSYSWIGPNGFNSPQQNTSINNVSVNEIGTYQLNVIDANGCSNTTSTNVIINATPNVEAGSNFSICVGTSITLTGFGNATSYNWDNGIIDGVSFTPSISQIYTVTGTDANNCQNTDQITVSVIDAPIQEVCVVTVDELLANHNIIFWEKPANIGNIDSFYVYREITFNNYQVVGSKHVSEISDFSDFGANPNSTSYKYKITVLDTCGNESDFGLFHKSIHLQYSGLGNFQWTLYEIENTPNQVASYNFWRDDAGTGTNWQIIQTISGSSSSFTDVDYASYPNAIYRVDLNWINGNECTSTKANINTSRSNTKGNTPPIDGINTLISNLITLLPNPTNNIVYLTISQGVQNTAVKIYNISGQEVLNIPITTLLENETLEIDITSLARGFYMVQINNTTQKLIVE